MKMNDVSKVFSVVNSLVFDNGFDCDENSDDYRFEQFSIVVDSNELFMKNSETREIWICDIDGLNVLYEIIENALDLDFGFERI